MDVDKANNYNLLTELSSQLTPENIALLQNVKILLSKSILEPADFAIIQNFADAYFKMHSLVINAKLNTEDDEIKSKIDEWQDHFVPIINSCYEEPSTTGKNLLTSLISAKVENSFNNGNDGTKSKGKSLSKSKNGIVYYEFPTDITNETGKISGFANSILTIIGVIILGIILGAILLVLH